MPCGGGGIGGGGALIMSTSMAATEPNRVGDESLLRPLLRTVPAAGEREVVEQTEEKNEGRPASRPTSAHDVCRSGFVGWGGPGFGCPAGNFSEQKVCVWGKALVVRDRGRRVGGAQGARFAGRRRAAFGIRWGFAAAGAGQTENRLQTLGSGRVKKNRTAIHFSLLSPIHLF